MTENQIIIELTRDEFEFLTDILEDCHDQGSFNEGWQSEKLQKLISKIVYSQSKG